MALGRHGEIPRPTREDARLYPYPDEAPERPVRETFTEEQIEFVAGWLREAPSRWWVYETDQLVELWRDDMRTK